MKVEIVKLLANLVKYVSNNEDGLQKCRNKRGKK